MNAPADLAIPASTQAELNEICAWDGFRPATYPASEFPVDVVRFEGSLSRPVVVSRARRAETLKALPGSLRERTEAVFGRLSRAPRALLLAHGRRLSLESGTQVMGIVNVTPDSFSDGGETFDAPRAVARALEMFEQRAAIVDVGGESTRPSSYGRMAEVPAAEELRRVVPVIEGIRRQTEAPLSIDTRKASVAREALSAGADLVNDVSGFRYDPEMAAVVASSGAAALLMHMKGQDPRTMQDDVSYAHPVADIAAFLAHAASLAAGAGVSTEQIVVDPGLGFGKSPEGNLLLLRYLAAFRSLGFPVAAGASRKGFVRRFSGIGEAGPLADRLPGSLACLAAAEEARAAIARVHDVAETVRFLRMRSAIRSATAADRESTGAAAR